MHVARGALVAQLRIVEEQEVAVARAELGGGKEPVAEAAVAAGVADVVIEERARVVGIRDLRRAAGPQVDRLHRQEPGIGDQVQRKLLSYSRLDR